MNSDRTPAPRSDAEESPTAAAIARPLPNAATGATQLRPSNPSNRAAKVSPVGWTPPNDQIDHPEWIAIGRRLGGISRCNQWWLGDWLRYGTAKWGEKYTEAARITGYDVRSLANMASIAAAFELSRRRDNLTWSHHTTVAGLSPEEQDRWLDLATAQRLSVLDLRIEIRSAEKRRSTLGMQDPTDLLQSPGVTCPQCGYRLSRSGAGPLKAAQASI